MADEIQLAYGVSGRTLYAIVRDRTGAVWNGSAFVAFNAVDWATYAVAMAEQGASGYYLGDFPAVPGGRYSVEIRDRAGGTPVVSPATDVPAGNGDLEWAGDRIATLAEVWARFLGEVTKDDDLGTIVVRDASGNIVATLPFDAVDGLETVGPRT